ncbi:MAG: autotransporter-associated beta strand repeat-containing protein [Pirellulales bacterium]
MVQIAGGNDRLPVSGRVVTTAGGVLDLNGFNQSIGSLASAHGIISGAAVDGGWIYNSATTVSTLSVGTSAPASYTYGGVIYGNIALVKTGGANNVLTLLGANTYNGGTTLNGGVISVSNESFLGAAGTGITFDGGTLRFTQTGSLTRPVTLAGVGTFEAESGKTLTLAGSITGAGSLRINGEGTVQFQSAAAYTGTTDVVSGTLAIAAQTGASLGAGDLRLFGGRVVVSSGVTPAVQYLPNLVAAGAGTFVLDGAAAQVAVSINSLARSGRGTLAIVPQQGAFESTQQLVVASLPTSTNGIIAPWAVVAASGADSSGDFVGLSGFVFTRAAYSNSGSVDSGLSTDVFNANAPSTLTADRTVFALKTDQLISGNHKLTIGDGTGQAGLILNGGSIQTGGLDFGAAEGVVYAGGSIGSSISAVISGTAGLTKFGPQSLSLTGRNTYSGDTYVYGGSLVISADANLGSIGGNLHLGGATLDTAGRFATSRTLQSEAAGAVVNVTGSGKLTFRNIISGAALTKTGAGTLVLRGVNTYVGNTTLAGGKLSIAADTALGSGGGSLLTFDGGTLQTTANFTTARAVSLGAAGGTFEVAGATTLTYTGSMTGAGGLTKTGDGTLVVDADTTYTGTTTVAGGTLRLEGWNQYAGATRVEFGTLQGVAVGPSKGPFGNSASLTLNNGTFQVIGTTAQTTTGIGGAFTVGGGGKLLIDSSAGARTAMTFGSLAHDGSGTLVVIPSSGNLNNTDLSLTGGDFVGFSAAPTLTNTIIAPWAVRQESPTDSTGDFLTLTGTYLQRAVYSTETNINAAVVNDTVIFNALNSAMLTGAKSVYALRMGNGATSPATSRSPWARRSIKPASSSTVRRSASPPWPSALAKPCSMPAGINRAPSRRPSPAAPA